MKFCTSVMWLSREMSVSVSSAVSLSLAASLSRNRTAFPLSARKTGSSFFVSFMAVTRWAQRNHALRLNGKLKGLDTQTSCPADYNGRCIRPRSQPMPRATAAEV